jgi:hypothetical protein
LKIKIYFALYYPPLKTGFIADYRKSASDLITRLTGISKAQKVLEPLSCKWKLPSALIGVNLRAGHKGVNK